MKQTKKAVIFAPFWRQPGHVGNYRVDRFVRWLAMGGFFVVLIRAGSVAGQVEMSWGVELTVRDPLGLYRDVVADDVPVKIRKPNKLRRSLAYWLFNPDPGILWARAAASHPAVQKLATGALFVLSSSPPESAHIGAATLAKKLRAELIIDMRDGWLDEPLKSLLHDSRLQRWREGRLERSILQQADKIFVTSPVWKTLLEDRLPFTHDKTVVLTNAYPPEDLFNIKQARKRSVNGPIRLVHAGRFTGSSLSRRVRHLLEPLLMGLGVTVTPGIVTLLGRLETADLEEVSHLQSRFQSKGWTIELEDAVPREELMEVLNQADGLLLLSASQAAIPSKLFEYLALGKPVFTAAPQSSAVWAVGEPLEQLFLIDYAMPDEDVVRSFLAACSRAEHNYDRPFQFSEKALSQIFMQEITI